MDKASNRLANVSTHASVRRRPDALNVRRGLGCFNSRLREEATSGKPSTRRADPVFQLTPP